MSDRPFPPLLLDEWQPTRDTLHQYARLVGRIRSSLTPAQKHYWHVCLHLSARGPTTTPVPIPDGRSFAVELDWAAHRWIAICSDGRESSGPLVGQSLATLRDQLLGCLALWGIEPPLVEPEDFDDDTPLVYDPRAVARFWGALVRIDAVLKRFRATLREESGPVVLWPHHFDLAMLWFSGRLVPGQDPANPDYADEQINIGFVTGDELIPEPYFYVTAYPTPDTWTQTSLPHGAVWHTEGFTGSVLPYRLLTEGSTPEERLLEWLSATHVAAKERMLP
jgi:hypothetical protein